MTRQTVSSLSTPRSRSAKGLGALALSGLSWLIQRDAAWRETRRMSRLSGDERRDMGMPRETHADDLPRPGAQGW